MSNADVAGDIVSNTDVALRFEEIYRETNKAVLTLITVKCGRVSDISDIFQETYLELYQILLKRGVTYLTNERALVLKLARQKVSKYCTMKQSFNNFISTISKNEAGDEIDLANLEADSFLLENYVINQMTIESAKQLIGEKSEKIKKIFYLYYDVGLKISEIAKELSISESTVKNKLYRTLKDLKKVLNESEVSLYEG